MQINGRVPDEGPVYIAKALSEKLKPHQVEGIRFMWDNLVQTLEDFSTDNVGLGAILAHSMGLGKTLQVVTFLHTLIKNPLVRSARSNTEGLRPIRTALVIAPVNTLANWEAEFQKWLPSISDQLNVYNLETAGEEGGIQSLIEQCSAMNPPPPRPPSISCPSADAFLGQTTHLNPSRPSSERIPRPVLQNPSRSFVPPLSRVRDVRELPAPAPSALALLPGLSSQSRSQPQAKRTSSAT